MTLSKQAKILLGAVVIAIILVASVAYYYSTIPSAPATIKLGFLGPLTPPGAYYSGVEHKAAVELGVEQINAAGGVLGKPIEMFYYDTSGIPEKATAAAEKLITADKIVLAVGGYHSSEILAAEEVFHKYGIPLVVSDASNDKITSVGYREIFRVGSTTSQQVLADFGIIKVLVDQGKVNRVVGLIGNEDYAQLLWSTIKDRLDAAHIPHDVEIVDNTATDFTPQLLKFKSMSPRPQLLLTIINSAGCFLVAKQAKEVGFAPTIETPYVLEGSGEAQASEFWQVAGDSGLYWMTKVNGAPQLELTPMGKKFVADFNAKYGFEPQVTAYESWDALWAAYYAIKAAGSTDPGALISALEQVDFQGARFQIRFQLGHDPAWIYHNVDRSSYIMQYQKVNQPYYETAVVYPTEVATGEILTPT